VRDSPPIRIRPLQPADKERYLDFVAALDADDRYLRHMGTPPPPDASSAPALLDVDGRRRIALAAVHDDGRDESILGVVRAVVSDQGQKAEFALIVRSVLKRRGLGEALLKALLGRLRGLGVECVIGHTFARNDALIGLVKGQGFRVAPGEDASTRRLTLALEPIPA
jgi:acetyltransferase